MARELVAQRLRFRVISLYLDLDPERFATAPARASQAHSLIDAAAREVDSDADLTHDERSALREDLVRLRSFLLSREPPFKGARALAVFCSTRDGFFEVVQLKRGVPARVVIERRPYVEPLMDAAQQRRWCVALVSRREGRIFTGLPESLQEHERLEDNVRSQHDQGGFSQANYERSYEKDTDDHLRRVAEQLHRRWRRQHFDRLALGGPPEIVPRLEAVLHDEVRHRLAPERIDVDLHSATENQIRDALRTLVEEDDKRHERDALDRLAAGIGSGGRAVGGPEATVEALNERRVQVLLLAPGFDRPGWRCPNCGLLALQASGGCPADGRELRKHDHLRESVVEAALTQDAKVMVVRHHPDLGPFEGIGALLRF